MQRKIDLGKDLNYFVPDPNRVLKPTASFLQEELPKSPEIAYNEAREQTWENWINSEPLLIGHQDEDGKSYLFYISELMQNKIILLHVWDYTLLPCMRALSYWIEWHRRYQFMGLLTVGIHSPFFEFGKDKANLQAAAKAAGLTFPIVLDNNFAIWKSLENRYWPRSILLDAKGTVHADQVGEGNYRDLEASIQNQLRSLSPGLACPPLLKPLRKIDDLDLALPEITPDQYFGAQRKADEANEEKKLSFRGPWVKGPESFHGVLDKSETELAFSIECRATDVYLVCRSKPRSPADPPQFVKVQVWLGGKPVPLALLGEDCRINEFRRSVITVNQARRYHVLSGLPPQKSQQLDFKVETDSPDTLEVHAMFFEARIP